MEITLIAMFGLETVEREKGDATQRNEIMHERYIALVESFVKK